MMPAVPVPRFKARLHEEQMGNMPFTPVGCVVIAGTFGGAMSDDVVLLSSLRRLSGGFTEKDMKKRRVDDGFDLLGRQTGFRFIVSDTHCRCWWQRVAIATKSQR
jgi:hypothetical protein